MAATVYQGMLVQAVLGLNLKHAAKDDKMFAETTAATPRIHRRLAMLRNHVSRDGRISAARSTLVLSLQPAVRGNRSKMAPLADFI